MKKPKMPKALHNFIDTKIKDPIVENVKTYIKTHPGLDTKVGPAWIPVWDRFLRGEGGRPCVNAATFISQGSPRLGRLLWHDVRASPHLGRGGVEGGNQEIGQDGASVPFGIPPRCNQHHRP